MKEKVIFFDIDGTLVNEEKVLFEETRNAIYQLKENNITPVLATGRPPFWYEDLRRDLQIDSYISYNGQHIVLKGELFYENPIHEESLIKLYEEMQSHSIPMAFLDSQEMVVTASEHPLVEGCFTHLIHEYPRISHDFHRNRKIFQSLLFMEEDLHEEIIKKYSMFDFLRWHKHSYDILPRGCSKAIAIKKVTEALGGQATTYAFGDGANDLEMIMEADIGIAMGNALEHLKEAADYVTEDVNNHGVKKALKKLKLI